MKKYKLLKDTPDLKAGTVFEESTNYFDTKFLINEDLNYQFVVEKIENFDDWFEEIPEEYKRCRVKRGVEYWYINEFCEPDSEYDNGLNGTDQSRYVIGNYFKTEEETRAYKEYLIASQVLLDDAKGGKFSYDEDNWCACYSKTFHKWVSITGNTYYPGTIYFKTREALEESLKNHNNQWTVVRKYEMGEEQMIKMLKITKELDGDIRIVQGRMELRIEKDKWDKMTDEQRTSKFNYDAIVVEGYLIEDNETKDRLGQEPFVVEEYIV